MASRQTVVLASGNPGKLREMQDLLNGCGFHVKPQSAYAVTDIEETGLTFIENALLKARHAAAATGLPALADDSGIEVDVLNGAPGIHSARFAAKHDRGTGDNANNDLLLELLRGVPTEQRTARFRSVIVLLRHAEDPAPLIAEGVWEGRILDSASGTGGFGYDPLFFVPETGTSAAALGKPHKNALSHRGKALRSLLEQLNSRPLAARPPG